MRALTSLFLFSICVTASVATRNSPVAVQDTTPAPASDAAKSDTVKIDNDIVRITEIEFAPNIVDPAADNGNNRVLIPLDPLYLELHSSNGRKRRQRWQPGEAIWIAAGESDSTENLDDKPARAIEIQLKRPAPLDPQARNPKLDPVALDPKHDILLFENDQVRVFRSWREPHASETMHEHAGAGRASILLTDLDATVKSPGGSTTTVQAKSGDVLWSAPVTHATTNLSKKKFEMIVVEVK